MPPENLRIVWLDFQVGNELLKHEKEELLWKKEKSFLVETF